MKKIAVVSACLLGEFCRYDGKTKTTEGLREALRDYELLAFCPEAPLFGTPRERISLYETDEGIRVLKDANKEDVTESLKQEIEEFIKKHPQVNLFVLKSKSPSCANANAPLLNENMKKIGLIDGLATKMFKEVYTNTPFKDENSYLKSALI